MEATDFSEAQKREAFVNFYQTTHHIPGDKNLRRFCRKVLQNLAIRITAIVTKFLISALSFFCVFFYGAVSNFHSTTQSGFHSRCLKMLHGSSIIHLFMTIVSTYSGSLPKLRKKHISGHNYHGIKDTFDFSDIACSYSYLKFDKTTHATRQY